MNRPAADPNTQLLDRMVGQLGDIADELVFIGGCATGLFITTPRVQSVRVTTDVDVIAEATTILEYHALEARLRAKGFKPQPDLICRWNIAGLQLDLLPSGPDVLSFHNRWYPQAVASAQAHTLPSGRRIRLVSSALFLATKFEAFHDRGNADFLASHDLEDIITVVDGRETLTDEVAAAPDDVRDYLRSELTALLRDDAFVTALPGHLPGDVVSQARLPQLLEALRRLAA